MSMQQLRKCQIRSCKKQHLHWRKHLCCNADFLIDIFGLLQANAVAVWKTTGKRAYSEACMPEKSSPPLQQDNTAGHAIPAAARGQALAPAQLDMQSELWDTTPPVVKGQALESAQADMQSPSLPDKAAKPKGAASTVHKQQGLSSSAKEYVIGQNSRHSQAQLCQQDATKHAQHGTTPSHAARVNVSVQKGKAADAQQSPLPLHGRAGEEPGKLTEHVSAAQLKQTGQTELAPVRGTIAAVREGSFDAVQLGPEKGPEPSQTPSRQVSASVAGSKRPLDAPVEDVSKRHKVCAAA